MTLNEIESSPNTVGTQIKNLILITIPSISIRALTSPASPLLALEGVFRAWPGSSAGMECSGRAACVPEASAPTCSPRGENPKRRVDANGGGGGQAITFGSAHKVPAPPGPLGQPVQVQDEPALGPGVLAAAAACMYIYNGHRHQRDGQRPAEALMPGSGGG